MDLTKFFDYMDNRKKVDIESDLMGVFNALSQEALKITMEINNKYHTPQELVELFSKLTGKRVDSTFRLFPPFYTDCGKNITLGKNVFINACCKFQDQGGISIGDGSFLGHNVCITTLNHEIDPQKRAEMYPAPVRIGKNVWIGSDVTILPGITIGDGAIVGAGSVVTKDVEENTIVFGNPAKFHKKIKT